MAAHPNSYLSLLSRNGNYCRLFAGRTVSLLGDWLNTIAVFVLLESIGAASALTFGTVIVLKSLPHLLLSPVAGMTADRFERRNIMICADLLRVGIVFCFILVPFFPSFYIVAALLLLQHSCSSFFEPARSALLPDLVEREDLATANALGAMVWSTMLALGAGLGGVLTELYGWKFVICLDALSYLASAWLLSKIRYTETQKMRVDDARKRSLSSSFNLQFLLEVLRLFRKDSKILTLSLAKTLHGIGGGAYLILTIFGQKVFPAGDSTALGISLLFTARGLGGFIGPFIGRRFAGNDRDSMRALIFWGFCIAAVCYVILGFTESAAAAALAIFVGHIGGSLVWVFSTVLLQYEVHGEIRGRVFSMDLAGFTLTHTVSILVYSLLLDSNFLDPRGAAIILGASWGVSALVWAILQRFCFSDPVTSK